MLIPGMEVSFVFVDGDGPSIVSGTVREKTNDDHRLYPDPLIKVVAFYCMMWIHPDEITIDNEVSQVWKLLMGEKLDSKHKS